MHPPASPLVAASTLHERVSGDAAPILLDVRWQLGAPSQRAAYDEGHLPGAVWVEFEDVLSGVPGAGGRHPMPNVGSFESAMRAAGVDSERPVVVYDSANSLAASRAWWLLRYFGKEDVQVLDGGYAAWLAAGLPVTDEVVEPAPGDFVATAPNATLLDAEGAAECAAEDLLLDARPGDRFLGRNEVIDPVAGHIPGARSAPALANLAADGRFLPPDDLALRFTALGVRPEGRVGVYCGSGVQATHLALALQASGMHCGTGVYIGSWSHWITDPERPVELTP